MTTHVFPKDSLDQLIADRLPPWLAVADPEQVRALHQALRCEQAVTAQIASHFASLPPIDAFAEPLLTHALQQAGLAAPEVRAMRVLIEQQIELPSVSPKLLTNYQTYRSRHSLLASALHNFHVEELTPDLLRQAWLIDAAGKRLPLGFEDFVRCCRTLDLGGQYQQRLTALLSPKERPPAAAGSAARAVESMLENNLRVKLEVAMRLARLKGELAAPDFDRLLPLWALTPNATAETALAIPRQLYLLGKCIRGVVGFEQREAGKGALSSITLWIPQDPAGPVTQHRSWEGLYGWLGERLRAPGYRRFFARFISERDRPAFVQAMARVLKSAPRGTPAQLDGRNLGIDAPLFVHLRRLQTAKMLDDARLLVVPTGDEDLTSRHARLQAQLGAGFDLLNLAALFVPGLGEAVLAISVVQIAEQVYQGYEDWRIGDRQGALDHLFAVAEMVVSGVAIGVAGQATAGALKRVAFVDELVPALDSTGRVGLARGEQSVHGLAEPGELIRRLGEPFGETLDWQAQALLQVLDLTPDQLRRLHAEGAPPLARLHDAHERIALHERLPGIRGEAFEAEYRHLQAPASDDQAPLLRAFPSLSVRQAAELLEQADTRQIAALHETGRVPLAIAERARWAIRDARLDRACLGLHIEEAVNADTERLVLGLVERSAPSASGTQLQIREGSEQGPLIASTAEVAGASTRVIVRTANGYRTGGESSAPASTSADGLYQALLSSLEPSQKALIGDAHLTERTLQQWLAAQADADRQRCAELLGMAPVGSGLRPPVRFADGRLGYPLSGRRPNGRQAIRSGLQRIYPLLSDRQMDRYVIDLLERRVDLWEHYRELTQTLDKLSEALEQWGNEAGLIASIRRRRVATQLRRCWRRKLMDYAGDFVLHIEGERVGSLPTLPEGVDFSHVSRVALRDMDLTHIPEDFLRRFSRVTELDLRENRLEEIPAGIEHLTELRRLHLSRNQIVMTQQGSQRLSQLSQLRLLDLNHNPLERVPELAQLHNLERINLRSTGLQALPNLTETLPWRAHLDLRSNRITQLRQGVTELWHDLQRVSLHGNPIEPASAQAYDRLSGVGESGSRTSVSWTHHPVDDAVLEHWLGSTTTVERSRRTRLWADLRAQPNAEGLFQFLADFAATHDFDIHPGHYQGRVWEMLDTAHSNEALRERLFETASGERTCEDRLLLVMSQLELSVLVERTLIDGPAEQVQARLLALERSLFRVDRLDEVAARHIEFMHQKGVKNVDEVEVRLYYRVMLKRELDLPATPDGMNYASYAQVSGKELRRAARFVLEAEAPDALAGSLAQRPFWREYVRKRYAQRFEALAAPFYERLETLESQALDSAQWVESSNRLKAELESAELALIHTLAEEAYGLESTSAQRGGHDSSSDQTPTA
ncbi:NEL-type E3 ubiquitin ligase domain-containing protein [Pseudomonas sp. MLB6B]